MKPLESEIRGRCACGRVVLRIDQPVEMFSHCHCRSCRSVHGTAFVSWIGVPLGQLRIEGEGELRDYRSSEDVKRSFCRHCGAHVRYLSAAIPDRVYVPAGLLQGPIGRAPESHVNLRDAVSWFPFEDGLPRFDGFD